MERKELFQAYVHIVSEGWAQFALRYPVTAGGAAIVVAGALQLGIEPVAAQVIELSTAKPDYDPGLVECAVSALFEVIEGAFGALVMVVAGLGAIVSAAMGAYRATVAMLVVAVGSFILRSLVTVFFGAYFETCDAA